MLAPVDSRSSGREEGQDASVAGGSVPDRTEPRRSDKTQPFRQPIDDSFFAVEYRGFSLADIERERDAVFQEWENRKQGAFAEQFA